MCGIDGILLRGDTSRPEKSRLSFLARPSLDFANYPHRESLVQKEAGRGKNSRRRKRSRDVRLKYKTERKREDDEKFFHYCSLIDEQIAGTVASLPAREFK